MRKFLEIMNGAVAAETPKAKTNMLARYVGLIEEGYGAPTINSLKVEEFVRGYIEAMLATEHHDQDNKMNRAFTADDISPEAMDHIEADCRSFLHKAGAFISPDNYSGPDLSSLEAKAGHDFFMQRFAANVPSSTHRGFDSGEWASENTGRGPLAQAAAAFPHVRAYVCDGKICLM